MATDPNVLLEEGKCFACLNHKEREQIKIALLQRIVVAGGISPPVPPVPPSPPVISATGYTDNILTEIEGTTPLTCGFFCIYESENAAGTGEVNLLDCFALPEGQVNYSDFYAVNAVTLPFILARIECDSGNSAWSNALSTFDAGNEWADRVEINGGVRPSAGSITAVGTFYQGLVTANLLSKMRAVNVFAPDNRIACLTQLIGVANTGVDGSAPTVWGVVALAWDVTINGIKKWGDASSLNTAIAPWSDTNFGFTLYISEHDAQNTPAAGCAGGGALGDSPSVSCYISHSNVNTFLDCWNGNGNGRCFAAQANWTGYDSFNRASGSYAVVYQAKSSVAHSVLVENNNNSGLGVHPTTSFTIMRVNGIAGGGPNAAYKRYSFGAVHDALTQAESAALYPLIQALRTSFGGGFA